MAERIACPQCGRMKPAFAIRDGRCGDDIKDEARKTTTPRQLTWDDIRGLRSIKLAQCDWTQAPDVRLTDEKKAAWDMYRQSLRDLPTSCESPQQVVWPSPPQ